MTLEELLKAHIDTLSVTTATAMFLEADRQINHACNGRSMTAPPLEA